MVYSGAALCVAGMKIFYLATFLPLVKMAQPQSEEISIKSTQTAAPVIKADYSRRLRRVRRWRSFGPPDWQGPPSDYAEFADSYERRRFRRHFDGGFVPGFGPHDGFGRHHRNRRQPFDGPGFGPGFGPDFGPGIGPDFGPGFGPGFGGRKRHRHGPRGPHGPHRGPPRGPHEGPHGGPPRGPHGGPPGGPHGGPPGGPHGGPPRGPHGGPPGGPRDGPPRGSQGSPYPSEYSEEPQRPNRNPPDALKFEDTQANNKPVLRYQTSCGVSTTSRIVGGEEVRKDDWSWTVALMRPSRTGLEHFCGATIVSDQHLITASHCVNSIKVSDLSVRVGHLNLSEGDPSQDIRVQKIIKHPQFNATNYYADIAIIKLQNPIEFSLKIQPCCLPDNADIAGRNGVVVGWGSTSFGGPQSQVLQQLSLPIWSNEECQSKISIPVKDVMICAGRKDVGGHDACQGDSGGPLLARNGAERWALEGIVSFGFKCAQKGVPGVYTRVSKFRDWIVNNAS